MDGPRYVTGLRDTVDLSCYKDILESDKYDEAKDKADLAAEKHQRNTIVFDRQDNGIIYRKVVQVETKIPPPPPKPQKQLRKRKPEVKVEKNAYFE